MSEQNELDLGKIENHPTPFKDVILREPRPHWHSPEVEEFVYRELAKIILEDHQTIEEVIEDCRDRLDKFTDFDSDYEVSLLLKDDLWCDDEWVYELRSDIELFSIRAQRFLYKKVKDWIDFWNIIPPVKVGDKIEMSRFSKKIFPKTKPYEHLVVAVREDEAKVVVCPLDDSLYSEEEALEKKAGYLIPYEVLIEWM